MRSSGSAPSARKGSSSVPNRVRDVMTTQVTTVAPETLVAEAIQLFGEYNIRHLLVTDQQGRLAASSPTATRSARWRAASIRSQPASPR